MWSNSLVLEGNTSEHTLHFSPLSCSCFAAFFSLLCLALPFFRPWLSSYSSELDSIATTAAFPFFFFPFVSSSQSTSFPCFFPSMASMKALASSSELSSSEAGFLGFFDYFLSLADYFLLLVFAGTSVGSSDSDSSTLGLFLPFFLGAYFFFGGSSSDYDETGLFFFCMFLTYLTGSSAGSSQSFTIISSASLMFLFFFLFFLLFLLTGSTGVSSSFSTDFFTSKIISSFIMTSFCRFFTFCLCILDFSWFLSWLSLLKPFSHTAQQNSQVTSSYYYSSCTLTPLAWFCFLQYSQIYWNLFISSSAFTFFISSFSFFFSSSLIFFYLSLSSSSSFCFMTNYRYRGSLFLRKETRSLMVLIQVFFSFCLSFLFSFSIALFTQRLAASRVSQSSAHTNVLQVVKFYQSSQNLTTLSKIVVDTPKPSYFLIYSSRSSLMAKALVSSSFSFSKISLQT